MTNTYINYSSKVAIMSDRKSVQKGQLCTCLLCANVSHVRSVLPQQRSILELKGRVLSV